MYSIEKVMAGVLIVLLAIVGTVIGMAIHHEIVEPSSGTVTKLDYSPPSVSVHCSGKPTICTSTSIPECYRVTYDGDKAGTWGDACVAPSEYPLYRIGDHFPRSR